MEKMKLYKVTFDNNINFENQFIIAIDEFQAVTKALDFKTLDNCMIYTKFICNRDEIIPTVEPIQEFKNQ